MEYPWRRWPENYYYKCLAPRRISCQKFPKRTRLLSIPSKPYSFHSVRSATASKMNGMIFRSFWKRNSSQKNTNTVYSKYSYSGIVLKEVALKFAPSSHQMHVWLNCLDAELQIRKFVTRSALHTSESACSRFVSQRGSVLSRTVPAAFHSFSRVLDQDQKPPSTFPHYFSCTKKSWEHNLICPSQWTKRFSYFLHVNISLTYA